MRLCGLLRLTQWLLDNVQNVVKIVLEEQLASAGSGQRFSVCHRNT